MQNKLLVPLKGIPVSPGIAIGKAHLQLQFRPNYAEQTIPDDWIDSELKRFAKAKETLLDQINILKQKKGAEEDTVTILKAQALMLEDPELLTHIESLVIDKKYSLDYAIYLAFQAYIDQFEASQNANLIERIPDLVELRDRLAFILQGKDRQFELPDQCILVAKDLGLHDLIRNASRIKAIVLERGGLTSHLAIIAHALGIPSVFGLFDARNQIEDGDSLAVDAENGTIWINPDVEILESLDERIDAEVIQLKSLNHILKQPSITRCGHPFQLLANAEFYEELQSVTKHGCNLIGLLRTETLLIQNPDNHQPNHQFHYYRQFLANGEIEELTIRLFDAGGDKVIGEYSAQESNPYLGWRGIRFLLGQQKLLRQQLYAILKLSGQFPSKVKCLIPMVSSISEVHRFKEHLQDVQKDLLKNDIPFDPKMPIGIMVEVPATALMSKDFVSEVDFFSIGTNDLTQYTMAADRGNDLVSDLYQQNNPAVWKLIKTTVDAASDASTELTVCGELASMPEAAAVMLGLGINRLSMLPSEVLKVKSLLIKKTTMEMKQLAEKVLKASSEKDVLNLMYAFSGKKLDH